MKKNLPDKILRQFQNGLRVLPHFESEQEEKIFLQFQKYNLLYITPSGIFKLTKKGEQALKGDIEKILSLERFEEKLLRDSLNKNVNNKIILFIVVPILILWAISLMYSDF